ncbi:MAG: hypothetical protein ACRDK7_16345 [Solirubrobacteraceae bacterium]
MEHTTVSQSSPSEPHSADTTTPEKAHGDRNFAPQILPGLGSGQILPVWLSERLSRLFKRATSSSN